MIIGVPKEIKAQENRVGLLPAQAHRLVQQGHQIIMGTGAGAGAGFPDELYALAGATILSKHEDVFSQSDMIVKVKEPLPEEYGLLREGQILFTYLHLAANKPLTDVLLQAKVTGIAYETVEVNLRHPLLEPMSEIAGRMSVLVGGCYLAKHYGGNGVLLGGVPGVLPGRVVVIGGGTAGVNAARMATGLGADVTILDVDVERMRFLDITLQTAHTLFSTEANILDILPDTDLIIGAVLVPGARAPKLITRELLKVMKPGSVFVDIAIDQGGCSETSHATTHHDPIYVEEGVIHYCVANMPAAYARTATEALTNVTFRHVELLANHGIPGAFKQDTHLLSGLNTHEGRVTHRAVAQAHGLECLNAISFLSSVA